MEATLPLVLVVDDNEMNRDMLSRRLQRQQCEVVLAENGAIALEIVHARPIDLVLLDIMMPGMSGYDVLETMKADASVKHIPVIMISAVDDIDSVVRCIEMGAEDYLFKPFNPVLLKARVGASLSRRAGGRITLERQPLMQGVATIRDSLTAINAESLSPQQTQAVTTALQQLDSLSDLISQGT